MAATSRKKPATKTVEVENEIVENIETQEITEEVVEKKVVATKQKKKFEPTEGIRCKSVTTGGLYMNGIKSHILYAWSDLGDETEVEYQDLVAAVRSGSGNGYITKPRFVIQDEDFITEFPQLRRIYENMYSVRDLRDVLLKTTPVEMKNMILSMPEGVQESLKHLASEMISKGTLDSVKKIKVLDEIYDTKLMMMTELFNS